MDMIALRIFVSLVAFIDRLLSIAGSIAFGRR
ncbi:hypothetical protein BH20CHL1_BH20CHL1_01080 [soil metagenome]